TACITSCSTSPSAEWCSETSPRGSMLAPFPSTWKLRRWARERPQGVHRPRAAGGRDRETRSSPQAPAGDGVGLVRLLRVLAPARLPRFEAELRPTPRAPQAVVVPPRGRAVLLPRS